MKATILTLTAALFAAAAAAVYFQVSAARAAESLAAAQSEIRRLENELRAVAIRQAGPGSRAAEGAPEEVLRSRIAELEREIDRRDLAVTTLEARLSAAEANPAGAGSEEEPAPREEDRERGRGFRERLEQLRTEDPQEYARIQQERETMRQQISGRMGGQIDFLRSLPASGLTPEQLENRTVLIERLSEIQTRMDAMGANPGDGEGPRELWRAARELAPLLEQERTTALHALARDLGYPANETAAFVDYVDYIDSMMSPGAVFRGIGGGRGGPGPGRGP